jgi:1A family penicillin-binding protein
MSLSRFSPQSWRQEGQKPKTASEKKARLKKILTIGAVVLGGLFLVGALALTIVLAWISRDLPDPNTLLTRDVPQTTKIYDRTGTHVLYEIHGDENRTLIQIKDLPQYVPHATVSIEDKGFYTHHGVYWQGLIRATLTSLFSGKRVQGTSTLTQQFVKNAILTNERSFTRKLKEMLLSLQIERVYSKDQILQMYLNEIPYGPTIYGIESAAQNYFGKSAKDLTLDEAALLAAIPQAPDLYSPYGTGAHGDNREQLVGRQHYILDQMAAQGYVSKSDADAAKQVDTLKKILPKKVGNISAPHFVMYIRSLLNDKYGQTTVENKGLKVITTLDWDKQQIAEDEVKKGVEARGDKYNFTNAALVSIDPKTGQILAMVGSKDFFDTEHDGQVNVVLRPRQPGSSFKPIVYAAGLIKGYTPETTLWDVNTIFKTDVKNYEPKNYDLKEHGPVSVRQALQGSLNIPAVKMLYLVGVSRVLDFADSLGYTTLTDRSRFGLSLVLGGGEVTLLEHANAYAAFANEGVQMPTSAILKVEDANGATLDEWKPVDGTRVVDADITHTMSNILSDNAARTYVFGANNYLTLSSRPAAAKTGTTNDFHDAWTLGYTPSLVTGVWVGNNNNDAMKRGADGSQIAAPIWQGYMKRALDKTPVEQFPTPPATPTDLKPVLLGKDAQQDIKIDKVSGKLATEFTPPEDVSTSTYRIAHDILYYVDKDDPRGPVPTNPAADPQFNNWENAVQTWATKNNWISATSTAPTGYDDVHTSSSQPIVTILAPSANQEVTSRTATVSATVSATRRIIRTEVYADNNLIGTKLSEPWDITVQFPNATTRGYHDLSVVAVDDVGNRGTAKVTMNLNSDPAPVSIIITDPTSGTTLQSSSFPASISVSANDITTAKKVDLFVQSTDGTSALVGSEIGVSSNILKFLWSHNPGPGTYVLYPVLVNQDGTSITGDKTTIKIQ